VGIKEVNKLFAVEELSKHIITKLKS